MRKHLPGGWMSDDWDGHFTSQVWREMGDRVDLELDKDGDLVIEHPGCDQNYGYGGGCNISRAYVPLAAVVELLRLNGYEVRKIETGTAGQRPGCFPGST